MLSWTNDRVRLRDLKPWERNPRKVSEAEARRLLESWEEYGQVDTIAVGPENEIYNGHQRLNVLLAAYGPDYEVEVRRASRSLTEKEREKLVVMLHAGARGGWDWDALLDWDPKELEQWGLDDDYLRQLYEDSANLTEVMGFKATEIDLEEQVEAIEEAKGDDRLGKVDIYFTLGGGGKSLEEPRQTVFLCCLAVKVGWGYGTRSTNAPCAQATKVKGHETNFIDNDFRNYDHEFHLAVVKKWRPKYCTVRDVFTEAQCAEMGIVYYPLEQILEWAEELNQYAENVIVIPKYNCIDQIPDKFVLGYSIPTSYAGTPVPFELFKGRRIHLLGGSPNKQIAYWRRLPDEVVSLDNNYILKAATFGSVWTEHGSYSLDTVTGALVDRPLYPALVLSLANFAKFWSHVPPPLEGLERALFQSVAQSREAEIDLAHGVVVDEEDDIEVIGEGRESVLEVHEPSGG